MEMKSVILHLLIDGTSSSGARNALILVNLTKISGANWPAVMS
jgi:hypothetical protein